MVALTAASMSARLVHVRLDGDGGGADLGGHLLGALAIEVHNGHLRPLAGEDTGNLGAEARGGARNERGFFRKDA